MENPFKPGDVVQLKSGSPRMTVAINCEYYAGSIENRIPGAHCLWMDSEQFFKEHVLPVSALEHAPLDRDNRPKPQL